MTDHSAEQPRTWRSRAFRLLSAANSHSSPSMIPLQASHTPQLPLWEHSTVFPLCVSFPKAQNLPHHPPCQPVDIRASVHSLFTSPQHYIPLSLTIVQLKDQLCKCALSCPVNEVLGSGSHSISICRRQKKVGGPIASRSSISWHSYQQVATASENVTLKTRS